MSVQKPAQPARPAHPAPAAVAYHTAERAILRHVELRSMTAVDQMFAYFGTDLA